MAELFRKIIDEHSVYAIWKITETTAELRAMIDLRQDEEELFNSFVAESRKKQWLAYRILVRRLLQPEDFAVLYNDHGKPYLAGCTYHISVTHTDDIAAVILSRNRQVGIDSEKIKPRVEKVKDKFLNDREMKSVDNDRKLELMTLAWCAKEALYKTYGERSLDFRDHIILDLPDHAGLPFQGRIIFNGKTDNYHLFSEMTGEYILVYLLDPPL